MAYHHQGGHHMILPPNNINTQYFAKDGCYKYSSLNFDESLAMGRISRQEVEDTLN